VDESDIDDDDVDDTDDTDDEEDSGDQIGLPTDQEIDQVVQRGLKAAAKGENVDHLLEVMAMQFSGQAADMITQKFTQALKKKRLQLPSENPDIPSRSKLARIHKMFEALIQKQAVARVAALAASKPEIFANAEKQGGKLSSDGARSDKKHLTLVVDQANSTPNAKKPKPDTGRER